MKVTVTKKVEQEVELDIQLPLFFKIKFIRDSWHCAVFDETRALIVKGSEVQAYNYANAVAQFVNDEAYEQTTEAEFTQAFEKSMELIQSYMPTTA